MSVTIEIIWTIKDVTNMKIMPLLHVNPYKAPAFEILEPKP